MSRIIAITGATGFAGRHTVAELLRRGHSVRALVRDPAAAHLPESVALIGGDLQTDSSLNRLLDGADTVIHLAGAITALTSHDYFRVNAHGTLSVAERALRAGLRRFVHISSLSAREPALSPYGASKRAGEDAISKLATELNAIVIRPPAVYGPGDRGTLPLIKELTRPIATIPGPRDARFSLIHAGDLARIIAQAAESEERGIHEVSDGRAGGYAWSDLIAVAEELRGGAVRPIFLPRAVPLAVAIAAESWSRVSGKPGMVNRGKVAELYHRDWVTKPTSLALTDPIVFAQGFPETVDWYRAAGWLPGVRHADRTGSKA